MLEIHLLGQYAVRRDGVPTEIASRPAKTLLAYLVLTLGTHHPRERLAGLLWPDSSESNARKNLRQALWHLRKAIGENHLLVDTVSIAFDAAADNWLDISVLEDTAEQDLENAVSVYRGELLPGFYEDWVLLERDRLIAVFQRKMERLLAQLLQEHRWTEALEWAERWIAQGQIHEAAYRVLMVCHAAMGELSKVDVAYQRCVEALLQEVGVEPSDETRALHERLIAGKGIPAYRYEEGPVAAVSHGALRRNLPAQSTPFIGRREELGQITLLLANTRLLTLTGPGGFGKTRLALKVAGDVLDQFSEGAHFVNLAPIRSADDIVQIIADALEFPLSTQEEPVDQLLGYLRKRQLLLVMDNFEHLLDGAPVVSRILQAAPDVKVLATSREKLELQGETTIGVAGMSVPIAGQSDDPLEHDAIELFVQNARRVRPGFEPSSQDFKHTTDICQMVDGMPLAIELAAAWLGTLSLKEIADELRRSLDILSGKMRDVPARHRSIRAVFDYSWSLINAAERKVFARLSVFRGGFTRDAAQHVSGASLELLASLVSKSFVRHDPNLGRFEMHELMRQYSQERLQEDPQASIAAQDAHASYYASFMHKRWKYLRDARQISALAEIDADIENVRTAWRYCIRQNDASRIRQFIHSMRLAHHVRGWHYAAFELFGDAAEALGTAPEDEETEALRALALAYRASVMSMLGLADQGIELARQGCGILRRLNRREDLAPALIGLIVCAQYLNLLDEEEQAVRELVPLAIELDDTWLEAYALSFLGLVHVVKQDYVEARRLAESSLRICEESGDLIHSSFALHVLGDVAFALGEYSSAREYYLRSLRDAEKLGFRWMTENSTKYLGHVALAMGAIEEAEACFHRSLQIADEIGLGRDKINLLYEFARVRVAQDRKKQAVELLALALEHPASHQARLGEGRIRDSAQGLLDKLEADLQPDTFSAAMQRGRRLDLDEVVAALIEVREPW